MKTVSAPILSVLQNAPRDGLAKRDLVFFFAWEFGGAPVTFGFWDGLDTVSAEVIDPDSGAPVSRVVVGSGTLLSVGSVTHTADLSIRRVDIVMSPLAPAVADMVFGHRLRGAGVHIHRAYLDPATRLPADAPPALFVGYVDGAPDPRPAAGGEAAITIRAVSDTRRLTIANPAKFDDAEVRARDADDTFGAYAGVVGHWDIVVGGEK